MTIKRTISALLMIILAVLAVLNQWIFIATIVALTIGGLYEFFHMVKKKGIPIYSYVGIFIGLLIPLSIFSRFELTRNWELLLTVLAFLLILFLQFRRQDSKNAIVGISTTLFGILYISWFFSFLVKIRLLPDVNGQNLLAFILLVTKMGDIGALFIGEKFGRRPLLPHISPNKSVEGCLGSLLFSIVTAICARSLLPEVPNFSLIHVAFMGAFFGAVGQLGDLSESLIKRDCNIKDSGKALPGMGGIMDVIDSLLFSAPAFYLYMSAVLGTL
ncbi:MAG: phosphatidate cytidylyltransferase [Candidatus Omnitrophota bacterium]